MPTIFSHAIAAAAAGQWWRRPLPRGFWFWTCVCAMLPDIDVIGFSFGIPYESMLGHRGLTHSLAFAVVVGFLVARSRSLEVGSWSLGVGCLWFTAVIASHGILDACTDGGRGIAFLAPFSAHRYFLPWRPIAVSPIGAGFFSARGLRVLASESLWIWLPSAIIAGSAWMMRGRAVKARPTEIVDETSLPDRRPSRHHDG